MKVRIQTSTNKSSVVTVPCVCYDRVKRYGYPREYCFYTSYTARKAKIPYLVVDEGSFVSAEVEDESLEAGRERSS